MIFLLRVLLFGMLFYYAFKFLNSLLSGPSSKVEVKGKSKGHPPMNLEDEDVEDAEFEDLDD